jgi:hypothetical protein
MSAPTPADKPKPDKSDKPKKSRPPSPPRRKNRFNEREFARACRAARAVGASGVSVDPRTGIYTITFSDKDAAARTDAENLLSKL